MNAIRLYTLGDPAGLVYEQLEPPRPGKGEALIRVYAAAITRGELDWPADRLPAIPSYEFSGVVVALDPDLKDISIGESVYALSPFNRNGAAAGYISIPGELLAPKPRKLGHVQSAAIPLAALTAWQGLFEHGDLAKDQRILIHGATGGVGSFAVQLAHQRGAHVIGTVSTMNVEIARELGADEVIDHTKTRFEEIIEPVDLVFDTVGGDRQERSLSVVRPGGRLLSVATEPSQESAAARGISAVYFVVTPNREQLIEIANLVDRGDLYPLIAEVFPLTDARKAFERSLINPKAGKIVLSIYDEQD
jgi:NADPH:quinone reductase-like Zn-dependent oxidoreductase